MEGPDTHRGGCRGRARSWGEGRPRHIPGREYGGAGHVPGGGALWRDWARSGGDGVAGHVPGVMEGRVGLGPALTGRGPALPLQPRPPCCRTRR